MNSNLRRSRWRETGFMLRELRHAILPPHHLTNIFRDWKTIVAQLAEPRRRRRRYAYS
jgi:hypothetical protein